MKQEEELPGTVIVTEGKDDAKLLKTLLSNHPNDQYAILAAEGIVNAISIAHVLRNDQKYWGTRVALVIDGDKDHRNAEYAKLILSQGKDDKSFLLVVNDPEIEIMFFEFAEKQVLEIAIGGDISPIVWELGQSSPKKALELLLKDKGKTIDDLLAVPSFLDLLRKSKRIQILKDFIRAAEEAVNGK